MEDRTTPQVAGQSEDSNDHLTRRILGDEHYSALLSFFLTLFQKSVELMKREESFFVAFFTRRCHVLMQVFLNIVLAHEKTPIDERPKPFRLDMACLKEAVATRFVTDADLLTMVDCVAKSGEAHEKMPELLVIDELLLHGRTLNSFLLKFETRLGEDEKLRAKFQQALKIYLYAQKDSTTLVLSRYRECVQWKHCQYLSGRGCGDLSLRLSQLVSVSAVNNVGYSWSLRIPIERDRGNEEEEAHRVTQFHQVRTTLQNIEQDSYIWLYPDPDHVKAICTVRAKTSAFALVGSRQRMYVPYIIFDRLPMDGAWELHKRMLRDFEKDELREIALLLFRDETFHARVEEHKEVYYRWICETNALILSYMLMRRFLDEVQGFKKNDYLACKEDHDVDFAQIARNYAWANWDEENGTLGCLKDIRPSLQAIWDWEPPAGRLEEYLDCLLGDADPVWTGGKFGEESRQIYPYLPIVNRVQDAVAEISYQAEHNALEKIASGMILDDQSLADWSASYSIRGLLERCSEKFDEHMRILPPDYHYSATIYHVVAIVLQCMDLGLLSMNSGYEEGRPEDGAQEVTYTQAKAGEQAQIILPVRYRNLFPVLELILENSGEDNRDLQTELLYFTKDVEKKLKKDRREFYSPWLAQCLENFLKELERCGQSLESWGFLCENVAQAPEPDWHSTERGTLGAKIESASEQLEYLNVWRGNEP